MAFFFCSSVMLDLCLILSRVVLDMAPLLSLPFGDMECVESFGAVSVSFVASEKDFEGSSCANLRVMVGWLRLGTRFAAGR